MQFKKVEKLVNKQINCTALDFNKELGLLAISLIDKEIKIYQFKESTTGKTLELVEFKSFFLKFQAPATCLSIQKYAKNSRPILCIGSNLGDVGVYYLDSESSEPQQVLRFNFIDKNLAKLQQETPAHKLRSYTIGSSKEP